MGCASSKTASNDNLAKTGGGGGGVVLPREKTPIDAGTTLVTPVTPEPVKEDAGDDKPPVAIVTSNEIDVLPIAVGGVAAVSAGAAVAASAPTSAVEVAPKAAPEDDEVEDEDVVVAVEEEAVNAAAPTAWEDEPEAEEEVSSD